MFNIRSREILPEAVKFFNILLLLPVPHHYIRLKLRSPLMRLSLLASGLISLSKSSLVHALGTSCNGATLGAGTAASGDPFWYTIAVDGMKRM